MKIDRKRNIIQLAAVVFVDGFVKGFNQGKIFKGSTKKFCVPVLNCYSCPGAWGACPIGSLQNMLQGEYKFTFYLLGLLMLFGIFLGRGICGFLCPFGLIQGLLHKIPVPKLKVPAKIDKPLRWLKYVILAVMVILLPLFLKNEFGVGTTYFCKYICPAGTLEAGIPMLLTNEGLRNSMGMLFNWKMTILIVIVVLSIVIYRPFCKYFCPLGAIYSFFNKIALFHMELDKKSCVDCKACERACLMNVEVTKEINGLECIRCGKCMDICPKGAISMCLGPAKIRKTEKTDKPDKKTIALFAALAAAAAVMIGVQFVKPSATVKTDDGKIYNTSYDDTSLISLSGNNIDMTAGSVIINKPAGFAMTFTEEAKNLPDPKCLYTVNASSISAFSYLPARDVPLLKTGNAADWDKVEEDFLRLGYIFKEKVGDEVSEWYADHYRSELDEEGFTTEMISEYQGEKIYIAYLDSIPDMNYSEEEKAQAQSLANTFLSAADHIAVFPEITDINMNFFDTTDLEGNSVDQNILSDYDVTMVNVWATDCQACVGEMPSLEKIYESLGDNVNIISICNDADRNPEKAKEIAAKTGIKFMVLKPDDQLTSNVISYTDGFPYTIFVDSEGNRVGDILSGADSDEQKLINGYTEAISKALEEVQK